jgi:hypothetical protein
MLIHTVQLEKKNNSMTCILREHLLVFVDETTNLFFTDALLVDGKH